jgi:hypothetical protein
MRHGRELREARLIHRSRSLKRTRQQGSAIFDDLHAARRDPRCASSGFAFIAPSFVLVLGLAAHVAVGLAPVS